MPICDDLAAIEHGKLATLSFRSQGHHRSKVKVAATHEFLLVAHSNHGRISNRLVAVDA